MKKLVILFGFVVLLASGNIVFSGSEVKLDPSQFTGQARAAYAAAKKYPEVMNQVFCYCYCNAPPFKHKTLLSCFTDKHGAG
jgi:hypothetical protein